MTTSRIIVLLRLKPGKDKGDYEAWARATDLPTVNALPSVERFTLHEATGLLGSAGMPAYDYIEILDVADMEGFGRDVATDAMQRIAAAFEAWADAAFITTRPVA